MKSYLLIYLQNVIINQQTQLDLSNAGLNDVDINEICSFLIEKNYHIQSINLAVNNISDKGLARLITLKNIESINLERNNITQSGFLDLFKNNSNLEPTLRELNLSKNSLEINSIKNKCTQKELNKYFFQTNDNSLLIKLGENDNRESVYYIFHKNHNKHNGLFPKMLTSPFKLRLS